MQWSKFAQWRKVGQWSVSEGNAVGTSVPVPVPVPVYQCTSVPQYISEPVCIRVPVCIRAQFPLCSVHTVYQCCTGSASVPQCTSVQLAPVCHSASVSQCASAPVSSWHQCTSVPVCQCASVGTSVHPTRPRCSPRPGRQYQCKTSSSSTSYHPKEDSLKNTFSGENTIYNTAYKGCSLWEDRYWVGGLDLVCCPTR